MEHSCADEKYVDVKAFYENNILKLALDFMFPCW